MRTCPHPGHQPLDLCGLCGLVVPTPTPPRPRPAGKAKTARVKAADKPPVEALPADLFEPVHFSVEATPVTQGSMKSLGRGRMAHVNGPELLAWRNSIALAARAAGAAPLEGDIPVRVEVVFWLPRPATVKRARPTAKHDLDKLLRAVLDALTGVCFVDDGQVVEVSTAKFYADERHPPGARFTITLLHERATGLGTLAE